MTTAVAVEILGLGAAGMDRERGLDAAQATVTTDGARAILLRGRGDGGFDLEDAPLPGGSYSRR